MLKRLGRMIKKFFATLFCIPLKEPDEEIKETTPLIHHQAKEVSTPSEINIYHQSSTVNIYNHPTMKPRVRVNAEYLMPINANDQPNTNNVEKMKNAEQIVVESLIESLDKLIIPLNDERLSFPWKNMKSEIREGSTLQDKSIVYYCSEKATNNPEQAPLLNHIIDKFSELKRYMASPNYQKVQREIELNKMRYQEQLFKEEVRAMEKRNAKAKGMLNTIDPKREEKLFRCL